MLEKHMKIIESRIRSNLIFLSILNSGVIGESAGRCSLEIEAVLLGSQPGVMKYKRENLKNESNERPESNVYHIRTISTPTVLITISFTILDGEDSVYLRTQGMEEICERVFPLGFLTKTSIPLRQAIYYSQQILETLTVK